MRRISINEPVDEWEVIVTELVAPTEPCGPARLFAVQKFKSIRKLRDYFHQSDKYAVALSLGYRIKNIPDPEKYNHLLFARLAFHYKDRMLSDTFEFMNVEDFVKFLQEYPPFAKVLGYEKK